MRKPRRLRATWSTECLRWTLLAVTNSTVQCVWRSSAGLQAAESKSTAATFSMKIAFFSGSPSVILAPCAVLKSKLFYNCFFFFTASLLFLWNSFIFFRSRDHCIWCNRQFKKKKRRRIGIAFFNYFSLCICFTFHQQYNWKITNLLKYGKKNIFKFFF